MVLCGDIFLRKNLLTLAWIIEILLALIVLESSIAIEFQVSSNYIIGLVPFLLVSILPLSRIPLIKSYRRVQGGVMKLLKTLLLIVISLIIFETLLAAAGETLLNSVGVADFSNLEITFIYFLVALLTLLGPIIAYLSIYKLKGKD